MSRRSPPKALSRQSEADGSRRASHPLDPSRAVSDGHPIVFHRQALRTLACQPGRAFGAIASTSMQSSGLIAKTKGPALSEALGGSPSLRFGRPSTRPSYRPEYRPLYWPLYCCVTKPSCGRAYCWAPSAAGIIKSAAMAGPLLNTCIVRP
jgi:hypothetical protein